MSRPLEKHRAPDAFDDISLLGRRDGWQCHYCGCDLKPVHREPYEQKRNRRVRRELRHRQQGRGLPMPTRDHVVPIARGGPDTLDNMVLACQGCNQGKSDHDYDGVMRAHCRRPDQAFRLSDHPEMQKLIHQIHAGGGR